MTHLSCFTLHKWQKRHCFKYTQAWQYCKVRMGCLAAGEAAEDADVAPDDDAAEQLCSETELGRGTLRALWRWASFQV